MKYKIVEIYHNGKHGKLFEPRRDGRYPFRIGRIVEFDPTEIEYGNPAYIHNVVENDGTPCDSTLITSNVLSLIYAMGFFEAIFTENSIYMLADVEMADSFLEQLPVMTEMLMKAADKFGVELDEQQSEEIS